MPCPNCPAAGLHPQLLKDPHTPKLPLPSRNVPCCRIALELLKDPKGAEALTRRLAVVCLEDGLLHPQLPLVVWTMMALVCVCVGGG